MSRFTEMPLPFATTQEGKFQATPSETIETPITLNGNGGGDDVTVHEQPPGVRRTDDGRRKIAIISFEDNTENIEIDHTSQRGIRRELVLSTPTVTPSNEAVDTITTSPNLVSNLGLDSRNGPSEVLYVAQPPVQEGIPQK